MIVESGQFLRSRVVDLRAAFSQTRPLRPLHSLLCCRSVELTRSIGRGGAGSEAAARRGECVRRSGNQDNASCARVKEIKSLILTLDNRQKTVRSDWRVSSVGRKALERMTALERRMEGELEKRTMGGENTKSICNTARRVAC